MTADQQELNKKLDAVLSRLDSLERTNQLQNQKIAELSNAWDTAKGIVAFIRWTAAVSAGMGTAWAAIKGFKL